MRDGLLLIDKPQDWTSHDCVAILRRYMKAGKIGHTGTLDPMATGLLLIAIGKATRMIEYSHSLNKTYVGKMRLGYETKTDDIWGEKTQEGPVCEDFEAKIRSKLPDFLGQKDQLPPLYSAVRIDGRRLYEYARKGQDVEMKARRVYIESIEVLGVGQTDGYPELELKVVCGSGTFIRSLFRDLARAIGCFATMSQLRRTAIGGMSLDDDKAISMDEVKVSYTEGKANDFLWQSLKAIDALVAHLPYVEVNEKRGRSFALGSPIKVYENEVSSPEGGDLIKDRTTIRVYCKDVFLGIAEQLGDRLVPRKVVMPGWKGNRND